MSSVPRCVSDPVRPGAADLGEPPRASQRLHSVSRARDSEGVVDPGGARGRAGAAAAAVVLRQRF